LAVLIVVGLVLAMAAGTQYFAWRAHFDRSLGSPLIVLGADAILGFRVAGVLTAGGALVALTRPRLLRLAGLLLLVSLHAWLGSGGRIYAPYGVFLWYAKWNAYPEAAPLFWGAWILILIEGVGTAYYLNAGWRRLWRGPASRTLGSAHWGTGKALHHKNGLLLGREGRKMLRLPGEGHILTVAPTRSGKGVSAVIPNLLDHRGSIFATDPKGENYAVTARWRSELGQTVHAFDPFGLAC
jgi:type IV secretion system protein VirD4